MKTRMLVGAILLSLAFGSLHAFSVLALPLEAALGATRAAVSLGYALAITALTAGVYGSPFVMRRLPPAAVAIAAAAVAASGLVLAATGGGLASYLAGYGLMFGFANGIAYSLFLDRAALALPQQKGFAIGLVTATYGGGAALFALVLAALTASFAVVIALVVLAIMVILSGVAAAFCFAGSAFLTSERRMMVQTKLTWTLVMGALYFFGVVGGLMIIGHTAPLMESRFPATGFASLAVMIVAGGNIAGSMGGGLWAQRSSQVRALAVPVIVSAAALGVLFVADSAGLALAALGAVGIAYGGLIAAIPVVILARVGTAGFAPAFGRIFSAWGLAGLMGPSLAGLLFDYSGTYNSALLVALFGALVSLIFVMGLPKVEPSGQ